jgi:hypothetical protein
VADGFNQHEMELLDHSRPLSARMAAAQELIDLDAQRAKAVLIAAAADENDDEAVLVGVGRALARCADLTSHLTELDFRDMTDAAHDAYWDALPYPGN